MNYPKTFTDAMGRQWTVNITLQNDDVLEAVTGVSLVNLIPSGSDKSKKDADGGMGPLNDFLADPYKRLNSFCALVDPQMKAAGLTIKDIKAGMDGEVEEKMTNAILMAVHDFFRWDPVRQAIIRRVLNLGLEIMGKAAAKMEKEMAKINIDKIIEAMPQIDAEAIELNAITKLKTFAGGTEAISA